MNKMLNNLLEEKNLDVIAIRTFPYAKDPHFAYFTGLSPHHFNNNWVILEKNRSPLVIGSILEQLPLHHPKKIRFVTPRTAAAYQRLLEKKMKHKKVGLCLPYYPSAPLTQFKKKLQPKAIRDVTNDLQEIRASKTKEELSLIKIAVQISEEILNDVPTLVKVGQRENALALELEIRGRKAGADSLAYPTIVAFGPNAAIPHHISSQTKIVKGNYLLIDFGVRYREYCADLSRTFFVGKATEEEHWNHWVVRYGLEKTLSMIQEGTVANTVFAATTRMLDRAFQTRFPHALGHGIGIQEHDFPSRIGPTERWTFKANQVFAIEPAVYFKNKFGIRIEDDGVVTQQGFKRYSTAPRKLIEI